MSFLADLRYAFRTLLKSAGFTAAAVATLALAVGANTAIFSLVNGVLLRALPYPDARRLVAIQDENASRGLTAATSTPANFLDWRRQARSFGEIAAYYTSSFALAGRGEAEQIDAATATPGLFTVLGVRPTLGRAFSEEEATPGREHVAVLGHGLWRSRFGADRSVLSQTIDLDGEPYRIVGVMPEGFEFPEGKVRVWTPLAFRGDVQSQRGAHYLRVIARLERGVSLERADREMRTIAGRLAAQFPEKNKGWSATVVPLSETVIGRVRATLFVLLAAVGLVALIACANIANLLLVRASARQTEIAVRTALGAGRRRLIRQLLTESLLLAFFGGALGLLLAVWGMDLLQAFAIHLPRAREIRLDWTVLAFTAGFTAAAGIAIGILPALHASRSQPAAGLALTSRWAAGGRAATRSRTLLVVLELALAVALSAGAGLLLRSFQGLRSADTGLRGERVLTFHVALPEARYPTSERVGEFESQLLSRLEELPGVRSAGAIFGLPFTLTSFSSSFKVAAHPVPEEDEPSAQLRVASRGYFRTVGIRLRRGRLFEAADRPGAPPVLLASESAARKFWPSGDALGQRLRFGASPISGARLGGEIVGIVSDVREDPTGVRGSEPFFYASLDQRPVDAVSFVVATAGEPGALAAPARREVEKVDAGVPVTNVAALSELGARTFERLRFLMLGLLLFAGAAVLLAALGVWGVMSAVVGQRAREIAVRIAVGAESRDVLRLVLGHATALAAAGIAAGTAISMISSRAMSRFLFEVSPSDPVTLATAAVALAATAILASLLPATRAVRIDPVATLRS